MTLLPLKLATLAIAVASSIATGALAQGQKPAPANPAGTGWNATVTPAAPAPGAAAAPAAGAPAPAVAGSAETALDPAQQAAIKKVSAYFNDLANLKGAFQQTNPNQSRERGRMFVKKPGRFRFDYGAPSKKVIVSDGKLLAIQDHDLGNEDVVQLDQTVFRILLRNEVDLARDAKILEVQEAPDLIVLALQDRSPDAPGRIRLFLAKTPAGGLELKEWITTDGQGLDTRLELTNVVTAEPVDDNLFKRDSLTLKRVQQ